MLQVKVDNVEIGVPHGTSGRGPGVGPRSARCGYGKLRRRAKTFTFLGITALMAGGLAEQSAAAQISSGYSGTSTTSTFGSDEAWRTLRAFGYCYASRNLPGALALIATEPGSRTEADTYRRLFRGDSQCLGGDTELRMSLIMVRGAIAEGLYRHGAALPANLVLPVPEPGAPIRTLSEAARCYTAAHRDRVRALVDETRPGSRQEFAALTDMAPDFFRCVPDTARGRQFDSTQLRFRLAEALLRMPAASAGPR